MSKKKQKTPNYSLKDEICKICSINISSSKSLCHETNAVLTLHIIRSTRINMQMDTNPSTTYYSRLNL